MSNASPGKETFRVQGRTLQARRDSRLRPHQVRSLSEKRGTVSTRPDPTMPAGDCR